MSTRFDTDNNVFDAALIGRCLLGKAHIITRLDEGVPVSDAVEHPAHYNQYEGFEVVDVSSQLGFVKGNAFKYIARAGYKPVGDREAELQDLRKAKFYIELEIARVTAEKEKEEQLALLKKISPEPLVDLEALQRDYDEGCITLNDVRRKAGLPEAKE